MGRSVFKAEPCCGRGKWDRGRQGRAWPEVHSEEGVRAQPRSPGGPGTPLLLVGVRRGPRWRSPVLQMSRAVKNPYRGCFKNGLLNGRLNINTGHQYLKLIRFPNTECIGRFQSLLLAGLARHAATAPAGRPRVTSSIGDGSRLLPDVICWRFRGDVWGMPPGSELSVLRAHVCSTANTRGTVSNKLKPH